MKQKFLIYLRRNNENIGNCFVSSRLTSVEIIEEIIAMINNYNKRLSNAKLENDEFMIRFFSCSDKDGNDTTALTGIVSSSYNKIIKKYPTKKFILSRKGDYKTIGFSSKNLVTNEENYNSIMIDLDKNKVNLGAFERMTREEYERKYDSKPYYDVLILNLLSLLFYDLNEVYEYAKKIKNEAFMTTSKLDEIYIPFV